MPFEELDDNYLFKILVSIDKGTYEFGSLEPNVSVADIAAFRAYYTTPVASFETDVSSSIRPPAGQNRPLYVGAKLYNYFLNIPGSVKYIWPAYDIIYKIRQTKAIPAAKASATERKPEYPAAAAAAAPGAGAAAAAAGRGAGAKAGAGTGKRGGRRVTRKRKDAY
jgi:hypothetical protein